MTLANCQLNESCTSSQSCSSVVSHCCLMTCPCNQALTPLTHSLTRGPWIYVRNNIARWYAFLIRSLVMFTPSYSCHCIMNSSALSQSPLKISRGLPTSLSPRPPGITGAGGRGTGAGGPPPPGNPPLGGPPIGGLTHPNGILGGSLLLPCALGGSPWSGPIAQYRATSSSLTCPVIGLIVPTGTGMVSVRLIGSLMFSNSANVCVIS
jgi:hypothetical protein